MPIILPEPEPEEKLSPLEQERMKEQVQLKAFVTLYFI